MIDPVGFALENFDQSGRWRVVDAAMKPVDASGQLPNGTTFGALTQFTAALTARPDRFVTALTEKLMTYATGRIPNFSEKREIHAIVLANHAKGNGFKDLMLDLIDSETFRAQKQ